MLEGLGTVLFTVSLSASLRMDGMVAAVEREVYRTMGSKHRRPRARPWGTEQNRKTRDGERDGQRRGIWMLRALDEAADNAGREERMGERMEGRWAASRRGMMGRWGVGRCGSPCRCATHRRNVASACRQAASTSPHHHTRQVDISRRSMSFSSWLQGRCQLPQ